MLSSESALVRVTLSTLDNIQFLTRCFVREQPLSLLLDCSTDGINADTGQQDEEPVVTEDGKFRVIIMASNVSGKQTVTPRCIPRTDKFGSSAQGCTLGARGTERQTTSASTLSAR